MSSLASADGGHEEHGFVDSAGVRIHYAARGQHGPLLVMIHGFPDFWFTWRHQMPALATDHPGDRHRPARLQPQRPAERRREL
jgi:pimeloyl-ACP methyl ester carboxylesterase